ncbi:hypothetical protein BDN71DRAFT_1453941 [Pleurotus eryngii]|uniref:Uncharacterized protein n=1 Tax=Pleurotus eryngii TaxID=5323 RepID=A0A9P6DCV4_PLEER|nr:hypothetical protein BDN71DRAFT_1453941 [Pleurotus eryngii]
MSPSVAPLFQTLPPQEARAYYHGLPSRPPLVYRARTPTADWRSASAPGRSTALALAPVSHTHPLARPWDAGLGEQVTQALLVRGVPMTSVDVVRFTEYLVKDESKDSNDESKEEGKEGSTHGHSGDVSKSGEVSEEILSPATIWVGVDGSAEPAACHAAAMDILALLEEHGVSDVNIEFRESYVRHLLLES